MKFKLYWKLYSDNEPERINFKSKKRYYCNTVIKLKWLILVNAYRDAHLLLADNDGGNGYEAVIGYDDDKNCALGYGKQRKDKSVYVRMLGWMSV